MAPIIYPTVDELIETNRRALIEIRSKKADSHGVLSRPLLIAALEKVEAESGDLYDKAAVLLTELVRAHAFASGVRRTAYVAAISFFEDERPTSQRDSGPKNPYRSKGGFFMHRTRLKSG